MTEAEILAMPAGVDLNALVAEKVMEMHQEEIASGPPACSERVDEAWKVVEKLTSRSTKTMFYLEYSFHWIAGFQPIWKSVSSGETAPLAICRAALIETQRMAEITSTASPATSPEHTPEQTE